MKINCGGYGTTCKEAEKGIQCSAMKAEIECGKNGFEYIKNIISIGLCYSQPQCNKEFCKHEKIREVRNTVKNASVSKNWVTVLIWSFIALLLY
uniref:Uncharacterized protein n=1 Tax=Panagrolaimus sp. ES5 TaxID=591445 RepID=A0AC34GKA5_9BILA